MEKFDEFFGQKVRVISADFIISDKNDIFLFFYNSMKIARFINNSSVLKVSFIDKFIAIHNILNFLIWIEFWIFENREKSNLCIHLLINTLIFQNYISLFWNLFKSTTLFVIKKKLKKLSRRRSAQYDLHFSLKNSINFIYAGNEWMKLENK